MFLTDKKYIFKIKNPESEKGFVFYTGTVTDIVDNTIFITTIKDENISFQLREILKSKELND